MSSIYEKSKRKNAEEDSLAEWSKALASGASPKGRGFESHSCHTFLFPTLLIFFNIVH